MISSDELHNLNCFRYLKAINKVIAELNILPTDLKNNLSSHDFTSDEPKDTAAYGDLYTQFISQLEKWLEVAENFNQLTTNEHLRLLAITLYQNDNNNLQHTYNAIKECTDTITPINPKPGIKKHTQNKRPHLNKTPPNVIGGFYQQTTALFKKDFKPQHTTSIPSIRRYAYNFKNNNNTEIRMGTQAQLDNRNVRISQLFLAYLKALSIKYPARYHLYINNLPTYRITIKDKITIAITHEIEYANELIALESTQSNLIVVTLPAAGGYIDSKKLKDKGKNDVIQEMLNIAMGKLKDTANITDFYISDKAKQLIFNDKNPAEVTFSSQLLTSLQVLGLDKKETLSPKEQQALWFHFIKFELTQYIINQLAPTSYNLTCKDGIDRGGVSSAYYHLQSSFRTDSPFTRAEFDQALHAAPTMVKGRGMNFHHKIIWNAINHYVNANFDDLFKTPNKAWLIDWRDMNCPHAEVKSLLKLRVSQSLTYLTEKQSPSEKDNAALAVTKSLASHIKHDTSGQRLLLEAQSKTISLLVSPNPSKAELDDYTILINTIQKDNSEWKMLGGMMTLFLAICTLSSKRFKKGLNTFNAGFYKSERDLLIENMFKAKQKFLIPNVTNSSVLHLIITEIEPQETSLKVIDITESDTTDATKITLARDLIAKYKTATPQKYETLENAYHIIMALNYTPAQLKKRVFCNTTTIDELKSYYNYLEYYFNKQKQTFFRYLKESYDKSIGTEQESIFISANYLKLKLYNDALKNPTYADAPLKNLMAILNNLDTNTKNNESVIQLFNYIKILQIICDTFNTDPALKKYISITNELDNIKTKTENSISDLKQQLLHGEITNEVFSKEKTNLELTEKNANNWLSNFENICDDALPSTTCPTYF